MKVVFNKFLPFKGFMAMQFCGIVFVRKEYEALKDTEEFKTMLNHEAIHLEQQKELGFILFYLMYLVEWLDLLIFLGKDYAYDNISFEREAYLNEHNEDYIKTRKHYSFMNYM